MIATPDNSPFVVSFNWLRERLGQPGLKIVDASWYLPVQNRSGPAEFAAARIPGAVFFDQDRIIDPDSELPHALPGPDIFARAAAGLGLSDTDTIVVYDGPGMFTAPRVWWLLRTFGAGNSYVLDGGFDSWKTQGLPVEDGKPAVPAQAEFNTNLNSRAPTGFDQMRAIVDTGTSQIADARGPHR